MESLFARRAPKRGRLVLMLAGSLVFHGGLVGIGALFMQTPPPFVPEWFPPPESDGPPLVSVVEPLASTEVEPVPSATPDAVDPTDATPPPVTDDLPFAEPASPTPRQKTPARTTTPARIGPTRTTVSPTTLSKGGSPGGVGGGPVPGTLSWVMPHPSYPSGARRFSTGAGTTTVRITTDSAGRISEVVIVQSAGNPILDAHTISYVRENWRGPANATRTTNFVYQLR